MFRYVLKRLLMMIPVLLGVMIVVFTIMYITPGDPARMILGEGASAEAVAELREDLGLNDPYLVRMFRYIKEVVFEFDLGDSYVSKKPVVEELLSRFPTTLT